ncbi:M1 family metallopeptidase [soil metagenome]
MRHLKRITLSSLLVLLGFSLAAPPPTLFDTPWDDLSVFTNDLVPARQNDLTALKDAPVYHLELTLPERSSTITGKMEVRFTNTTFDLLDDLVFRLYPNALGATMTVDNVRVAGRAVTAGLEAQNTALRVPLALSLLPGEDVVVSIDFAVSLSGTSVAYGRLAQYEDVLSLADAYPTLSVFRDGAWETNVPDPAGDPLVAGVGFYLVRVRAPEDLQLVTTGRLTEESLGNGQRTAVFAAGPARDFYLAAATNYTLLSRVVGDTLINAYVPAGLVSGGERTLEIAARALELFSKNFTPYPYRELEIVAVPVTAGGIEYPGLVNLANSLYSDRSGTLDSVVAHEVAHQWSFNLVGSDQIEEPWLDESLAQYLTLLYHREYATERFVDGYLQNWRDLWRSAPDPDKKVGLPVAEYDRDYSAIVYGRGLFFYEALEQRLGRETVKAVLKRYYTRYAWDFVTTEDLETVAEEVCACDLSDLFEVWIGAR